MMRHQAGKKRRLKFQDDIGKLYKVKCVGRRWFEENKIATDVTHTKPGSLTYLLFGPKASKQSICIKFGHLGEVLAKEMIKATSDLELLKCGVQTIAENKKKKDIDLIWANRQTKTIYVRELKGNIELDTEKLPATFTKLTNDLKTFAQEKYPDYEINVGILNWSVYTRDELSKGISHIRQCEAHGVQVDHWSDFCKLIQFQWSKEDYYEYMREFGKIIDDGMTIE